MASKMRQNVDRQSSASELSVSVIVPTYQRSHLLGRALQSALRETEPTDEIIVVDDGSLDDTRAVVAQFGDQRIRYIWQNNSGAGVARNRGVREATRDLLAFLDSDDEWLSGKLALQRRFMAARPEVLFCFTNFAREFGGQRRQRDIGAWHADPRGWGEIFGQPQSYSLNADLPDGIDDFPVYVGNIYDSEMSHNYMLTSCLVARHAATVDKAQFAENTKTYEDWAYFGQLARLGAGAFLDVETTVQYGHRGPRLTDANRLACADARLTILRSVWGADGEFLARHGADYEALVRQQEQLRIRWLLATGCVQEAREAARHLNDLPRIYRALNVLPPSLLAYALAFLRSSRRVLGSL